jgi:hypothetical protein
MAISIDGVYVMLHLKSINHMGGGVTIKAYFDGWEACLPAGVPDTA